MNRIAWTSGVVATMPQIASAHPDYPLVVGMSTNIEIAGTEQSAAAARTLRASVAPSERAAEIVPRPAIIEMKTPWGPTRTLFRVGMTTQAQRISPPMGKNS